jgi:hypothetical protein
MLSSKNIELERKYGAGVSLSEAQKPIPPFTVHCIRVYSVLIHTGKGVGGESSTREKVRGATVHKAGSKIPT